MKKLFYFMLIVFAFSSCNNKKQYKIEGTIQGVDSAKVYLVKSQEGQPVSIDTSDVKNGIFKFEGKANLPEMYYLRLNDRQYFAQLFLENGKIEVTANKDSLRNTIVSGTETNDLYNLYIEEIKRLQKEYSKLKTQHQQAMMKGDHETAQKAKIDVEAMMDNMKVYIQNFVSENKNSIVAPFIYLTQIASQASLEELDSITGIFPQEFDESIYVKEIKKIADLKRKSAIGTLAPDFTMNTPTGESVSVSSFKGKYLLIDFWASWCGPCRHENPNVVRIYQKFKDKDFDILGVSLDNDKKAWEKAIKEDQLSWTQVSDLKRWKNEAATLYGVRSIPCTILLDKEGKIIAKNIRGKELEAKIAELLGE